MAGCVRCQQNGCFKCQAQEGVDLCPLCEDGVVCPEQKRVARVAAEKPAPRRDVYQPGSSRVELDQPASTPVEFSMCSGDANKFIEQGGDKLIHAAVKLVKEREKKPMPEKPKCVGCKGTLRKNSPGVDVHLCGSCFRIGQSEATPPRKLAAKDARKTPSPDPERRTKAAAPPKDEQPVTNVATFCLTEAQIDRLFLGSTFEAKVFALQTIIEQEQHA